VSADRFAFGANWAKFLDHLDDSRIATAEASLVEALGDGALKDRDFVDVGSGSGLSSLAARRLGARVTSFDYDVESVACTAELRRRYFPDDDNWQVAQGSALDDDYIASLGTFDVVLSWGVLHHTGDMWHALDNAAKLVRPGGLLFIAIYNDQGRPSRRWARVKKLYNRAPAPLRPAIAAAYLPRLWAGPLVRDAVRGKPFASWRDYQQARGMSPWIDVVDWVGGFPFEVAKPEQIFEFYAERGFALHWLRTCGGGLGCNEFVFVRKEG
jgi:2-polyprenyl-6-hydroxyphenyl methylase/3-demethylubiquinone-9 3-methyltransferase